MSKLDIDSSGLERGARGSAALPLFGSSHFERIENYESEQFPCHFHPEMELTYIVSGEMYYRANDREYHLLAGDAVFVNCNVMHAGRMYGAAECAYHPINFWPLLISGAQGSVIEQKYVLPMLHDNVLPACVFLKSREEDREALSIIEAVSAILQKKKDGWELLVKAYLCRLWMILYERVASGEQTVTDGGADAVKAVISFIEAHYRESLSLESLARAARLSRSEFCRTFKRFTGRTAFSYLQYYRVRRSLGLLQDAKLSVTDVASSVGFSGASYFAEVFRRYIGCSPLEYRKKNVTVR